MPGWLVTTICAGAASLLAGALLIEWRVSGPEREAPPPGRLIDIGGRRLHILCEGRGGPTVVLEAGGAAPSLLLRGLQAHIAPFAKVCLYDRAGFGWSDPAPLGRSFEARADDLFRLLQAADLSGPYVLVGESYGGLVVRAFAQAHPRSVAGVVLLDSAEEGVVFSDYAAFRAAGIRSLAVAPWLRRLGVLRYAVLNRPETIGLPASLSRDDRRQMIAQLSRPGYWRAARDELAAYDALPDRRRVAGGLGRLHDIPLTVITHGRPMKGAQAGLEQSWRAGQERLASLSSRGRLIVADGSAHDISLTDPGIVAREVELMVSGDRPGQAFTRADGPWRRR